MMFDTNIFIYADRGALPAKELIINARDRSISAVTYMEYVPFCRNKKSCLFLKNCWKNWILPFMKLTARLVYGRGKW
jgi:predicted nucleic acid-binding protein